MARVILRESGTERIIDLTDPVTVAGRALENKIVLQDRQASRRHCQFERTDWGYKLVDLESRNGTRVNERTVNQAILRPGDCIQIGQAVLIFEDPQFREPPPEVVARFGSPAPVLSAAAPTPLASPIVPSSPPLPAPPPGVPALPVPPAPPSPVPAPAAASAPQLVLRRRGTPTTRIDRGLRAAIVERLRERRIITAVSAGAVIFGLVIVILIAANLASGEPSPRRAARENLGRAITLRIQNPAQALKLIQTIPPDQQPYYDRGQRLKRQIEADAERQRAATGEIEQKEFKELYEFCEMNRNDARTYEQMYARCQEFRRKYPRSPFLPQLDEYLKISMEGRPGANQSEIQALEQEVSGRIQNNEYAAAILKVNTLLEKFKKEIEARPSLIRIHNDVLDRARNYWEAQEAKAKDLVERGQKEEARRTYEEALSNLGEGKVEELRDFCTIARTFLDALK